MKCEKKFPYINPYGDFEECPCTEDALADSKFCILHSNYPKENDVESEKIDSLKMDKIKEKLLNDDYNFGGIIVNNFIMNNRTIRNLNLAGAEVDIVHLSNVNIIGRNLASMGLKEEHHHASIHLERANIKDYLQLSDVKIHEVAFLEEITCNRIIFNNVYIARCGNLSKMIIYDFLNFVNVVLDGDIKFDNSKFLGHATLNFEKIKGSIYLDKAEFQRPKDQEKIFRLAKTIWEEKGDRVKLDECFYKEMEAKRKQKSFFTRSVEKIFIQYIFGYGVYPWRLILSFICIIFAFAFLFGQGNGIVEANSTLDYLYFSVVSAATPGYGGYTPQKGIYQLLAIIEAILGTFMWAAFIATFTRKYMR